MAHSSFLTVHNGKMVLILVLSKDSMNRIERHDPLVHQGDVVAHQIRCQLPQLTEDNARAYPISLLDIMVCHEEEADVLAKARELGDGKALMLWLSRNWSDDDRPVSKDGYTYVEAIKRKEPK